MFVGMIPKSFNESDIVDLFSPFGTIEDCSVLKEGSGQSKGRFLIFIISIIIMIIVVIIIKNIKQKQSVQTVLETATVVVKFVCTS